MMSEALASIGDNTIDLYIGRDSHSFVGGNALNVAVQLARLGRPARYLGAVGPDPAGERIREQLAGAGVDVAGLAVLPGRTSISRIRVDQSGDRHFEFEDFGVCAGYVPDAEALESAAACRAVHIGLLPAAAATVRERLSARGVLVSQDCGVTRGYEHLDVAFCSAAAAAEPAEKIARDAIGGGAKLAVVTCGADGSLAFDGERWWRAAPVPVDALDTTGAGDSYTAGFLDALLAGAGVGEAMKAGSANAALTCTHFGGWPQVALPPPAGTA